MSSGVTKPHANLAFSNGPCGLSCHENKITDIPAGTLFPLQFYSQFSNFQFIFYLSSSWNSLLRLQHDLNSPEGSLSRSMTSQLPFSSPGQSVFFLMSFPGLFRTDVKGLGTILCQVLHSLFLEASVQHRPAFQRFCVVADLRIWHQRRGLWLHPRPVREVFQRRLPDMQTAQRLWGIFSSHSPDTRRSGERCRVWTLSPRVSIQLQTFALPKAQQNTFFNVKISDSFSSCPSWL